MATESEADDFGKKISVITQHGFTALAIAYGSRLGLFEIMVKFSEPKTSQEIADAAGFKERSAICNIDYFLKISLSGQRGITGLEIKIFFQGAQWHLQKQFTGVVCRNQYIFGLPAEI